MDQSIGFPGDGAALRDRSGSASSSPPRLTPPGGGDAPFSHLGLDHIFPDDVYTLMMTAMPVASDYRPMSGRASGHDAADGTHTRVKIDLFSEYIRHLPPEKRAVWDIVGRVLCSNR